MRFSFERFCGAAGVDNSILEELLKKEFLEDPKDQDDPPASSSPLIWALLSKLPKPGSVWLETERQLWLKTMETTFDLEYREKSQGEN